MGEGLMDFHDWIEKAGNNSLDIDPIEEADITVEMHCTEELRQLCQKMKIVISLIDPSKCIVDNTDLKHVEVACPFELKLHAKSTSGKP